MQKFFLSKFTSKYLFCFNSFQFIWNYTLTSTIRINFGRTVDILLCNIIQTSRDIEIKHIQYVWINNQLVSLSWVHDIDNISNYTRAYSVRIQTILRCFCEIKLIKILLKLVPYSFPVRWCSILWYSVERAFDVWYSPVLSPKFAACRWNKNKTIRGEVKLGVYFACLRHCFYVLGLSTINLPRPLPV